MRLGSYKKKKPKKVGPTTRVQVMPGNEAVFVLISIEARYTQNPLSIVAVVMAELLQAQKTVSRLIKALTSEVA